MSVAILDPSWWCDPFEHRRTTPPTDFERGDRLPQMISAVLGVLWQLSVELGQAHQAEIQFFARTLSLRPIDEVAQLRLVDAAYPAEHVPAQPHARISHSFLKTTA